jgi:hypothetical protein
MKKVDWSQMPDAVFKKEMSKMFKPHKAGFGCDFEFIQKEKLWLIEYENSSRGLASNTLRVFRKMNERANPELNIELVLVQTKLHQEKHNGDLLNAKWLIQHNPYKNLQIKIRHGQSLNWKEILNPNPDLPGRP